MIGGPGSVGFLFVSAAIAAVLWRYRRTRRVGRWLLALLVGGYVVLSIPAVAHVIAGSAPATPAEDFSGYGTLDDVYVIDGDNYQARAATAVRLTSVAGPRRVWIVGGPELKNALIASGIPDELWRWNGQARTTYDQTVWVQSSMRAHGSRRAALVVSRVHAGRVIGLVRRANLDVIVVSAPVDREPAAAGAWRWVPSLAALALSREALYERVAVAYYRRNGWI